MVSGSPQKQFGLLQGGRQLENGEMLQGDTLVA
jgi:hypothetical protein